MRYQNSLLGSMHVWRKIYLGRPDNEEQVIDEDVSPGQDGEFVSEEEEE